MRLSFAHLPPGRDLFINFVELRDRVDIIMYSAIPWIQYTHVGRYFEELRRRIGEMAEA